MDFEIPSLREYVVNALSPKPRQHKTVPTAVRMRGRPASGVLSAETLRDVLRLDALPHRTVRVMVQCPIVAAWWRKALKGDGCVVRMYRIPFHEVAHYHRVRDLSKTQDDIHVILGTYQPDQPEENKDK